MSGIRALIEENRAGRPVGLPSFCTANEMVLRAILGHGAETGWPTLIEATCNQVNQDGGYTGMTPRDFMAFLGRLAVEAGVAADRLIVGGDHLGPNPWRKEPVEAAMDKARELVRQYAAAGFRKIHLDASMACGGEAPPSFAEIARRAADLCAVAEASAPDPEALVYVIGTEVPIPGGETEEPDALDVTSTARLADTIATHREAFEARGLGGVWPRIVSVVTQPGVDFGHTSVFRFEPAGADPLARAIEAEPGLTFEAHSTDYQPTEALRALVERHFFFLKVGPELTFRFREAVYALADIEDLLAPAEPSHIRRVLADAMAGRPDHWRDYYRGESREVELLKLYSYSDRMRYYWAEPAVQASLARLVSNVAQGRPSETIVSRHFTGFAFGEIPTDPVAMIERHTNTSVRRYYEACGFTR